MIPSAGPVGVRPATPVDLAEIRGLLSAADLPLAGVPDDLAHFLVAESNGTLVGAIGLEVYGEAALLRSAVVHPDRRGTGAGEALVKALLAYARALGVRDLSLLTTTAERWFPRFGFERVDRSALPAALSASEELRGACSDTAIAMRLTL